ncbi:MAG: hypothetical protein PHY94_05265 [Candidatus Omnitrophica bacterium]|nr:hypothetical protein [Candidatus Omnitrophota bacterium]
MRKIIFSLVIFSLAVFSSGCLPFIIGGAVGVVGAVAISKDTVQGDTDKPYDSIWSAAYEVGRIQGTIRQEDNTKGFLQVAVKAGIVEINLIRLTHATTRIRISARRHHLPDLELANTFYTKIMEEAR